MVRWTIVVGGAFLALLLLLGFEAGTGRLAYEVGLDWSTRDRFPCPGLTGTLSAEPLLVAMGTRLDRSPPDSVVLLGDSVFTSSPGCGYGELPVEETLQYRLKARLGTVDVANFALWSGDWAIQSRETALLRVVQKQAPVRRVFVVAAGFPIPQGHDYPVLFSQLCHHPTCDRVCRMLCAEEGPLRGPGTWGFFRYFPTVARPVAGIASYVQTFVTAAPTTVRSVPGDLSEAWRTIAPERRVSARYEQELVAYRDPGRPARWKRDGFAGFKNAVALLRAGWVEGGLAQLWYKEWMRQLRGLDGRVVFVSQMPDPAYMAQISPDDRKLLEEIRDWIDRASMRAVPGAKLVSLRLPTEDYFDAFHWTPAGTRAVAEKVAEALK